ncbi:hypothetical protein O4H49_01185 [Kiloniella laminariae]|uniref:Uncharacterized protein n=1 Tax=Kiloniella laminariae TaxID=454162 RepID=A0ABT4LE52_9PROT|nr:hypothetical protein [Kiloniella laminariae]MCZ4279369.1 hypothetical protein [Kiloniella laminariae]
MESFTNACRRQRRQNYWLLLQGIALSLAIFFISVAPPVKAATAPQRVQVTGEIIDTWCYVTEIMGDAQGTAHHLCAVWCAIGGIPVSILGEDGNVYMVLRVENEDTNVANPTIVNIQTHKVTVDGDLYERDGVKYLFVTQVADDQGVVNLNHEDYGIIPFGK